MSEQNKIALIKEIIQNIEESLVQVKKLVAEVTGDGEETVDFSKLSTKTKNQVETGGQIIEGVFDGQNMIARDGKEYTVPANYASKSKLVEGDVLKLTVTPSGSFVFKQIGPIERDRLRGVLVKDEETEEFGVTVDDKLYKVLTASVTYFKGELGDEVIILVPKDSKSKWAAIENIIKVNSSIIGLNSSL